MDENLSISIGKQRVDVSVRAEIQQSGQLPSAYIQVTLHLSFNLYLVLLLVQGKQASLAKRLSAAWFRTQKGLIADMNVNVLLQVLLASECLPAQRADVAVAAEVNYVDVPLQVVFRAEPLRAVRGWAEVVLLWHIY